MRSISLSSIFLFLSTAAFADASFSQFDFDCTVALKSVNESVQAAGTMGVSPETTNPFLLVMPIPGRGFQGRVSLTFNLSGTTDSLANLSIENQESTPHTFSQVTSVLNLDRSNRVELVYNSPYLTETVTLKCSLKPKTN